MAFDDVYSRKTTEEEHRSGGNARATILPFFGFELGKRSSSRVDTYGGNIYVTQETANTYSVSKSATGLYNRYSYYLEWKRNKSAVTDHNLETKVQQWMKKNNYTDIWTTPYICPTLEDFHRMNGEGPKNKLFNVAIIVIIAISILLSIALGVVGICMSAMLPPAIGTYMPVIALAPLFDVPLLVALVGVLKYVHNRKHRNRPLKDRSQKYQDELRARYYKGMVLAFGQEIGEGMKALSMEREKAL